jgi:hypothetical protein
MQPTLYWISTPTTGRLATMARPRGGDWLAEELVALRELRVDTLVSLLTAEEAIELSLYAEPDLAREHQFGLNSSQVACTGPPATCHLRPDVGRSL